MSLFTSKFTRDEQHHNAFWPDLKQKSTIVIEPREETERFIQDVKNGNPEQPEFDHAAKKYVETVVTYLRENQKYEKTHTDHAMAALRLPTRCWQTVRQVP